LGDSLPRFKAPFVRADVVASLAGDALGIAVVSFILNVAFAKHFCAKNNYSIRPNQEAVAYGAANLLLAFCDGFPLSANYTRSLNADSVGVKTQLFSLVSSLFALAGILGIGVILKSLPKVSEAKAMLLCLLSCHEEKQVLLQSQALTSFPGYCPKQLCQSSMPSKATTTAITQPLTAFPKQCCLSAIIVSSLIDHCLRVTNLRAVWRTDRAEGVTTATAHDRDN